ncbi:MAG TPA: hypothetical protein VGD83_31195, partial [Streptosporangiaceae bacterium]
MPELPPGDVSAADCIVEVAGEKHQPPFSLLCCPAARGIMPVGGRDERFEQQGVDRCPVSLVAQFRRIAKGPSQLAGPRVVNGAGKADHQRRAQC